jgi:L-fucose mutarotase/ribose pyranase (RbsD/FucU family)
MILICSCSIPIQKEQNIETIPDSENWKVEVEKTLKSFGHRNWIVVADAAYPQQSNQSIKTLTVDANQLEVVAIVNGLIEKSTHVSANLFLDKEMAFVTEQSAKGIEAYSAGLDKILGGKPKTQLFHEDIIQELDESAKLFNVLIIKTDLAIPYTSVFFQLECGYWNAEAEESLRAVINKK